MTDTACAATPDETQNPLDRLEAFARHELRKQGFDDVQALAQRFVAGKAYIVTYGGYDQGKAIVQKDIDRLSALAECAQLDPNETARQIFSVYPHQYGFLFIRPLADMDKNAQTLATSCNVPKSTIWQKALREQRLVTESAVALEAKATFIAAVMAVPKERVLRAFIEQAETIIQPDEQVLANNFERAVASSIPMNREYIAEKCLSNPFYLTFPGALQSFNAK